MKTLSLLIITLFFTISAIAQPWSGPVPGNIYYNQGNVGIGTTSPGSLGTSITTLQIVGGSTNPSTRSGGWRLTSYDASLDAYGYFANSILYLGTGSNHDMSLFTNGVERLTILKGGNVGIGTTIPSSKLEVSGGDLRVDNTNNGGWVKILQGYNTTYRSTIYQSPSALEFGTADSDTHTPKLSILSANGNVGIGTTLPSQKLDVVGSMKLSSGTFYSEASSFVFRNDGGSWTPVSSKGLNIGDWDSSPNYGDIMVGTYDFNVLKDDGSSLLKIQNNGNVGIGTTTPEAKLTVKGKIVASEIQVKNIGVIADYVFKPDYQLMSLDKVEDFVKQNQHLPEVPSEKEFKKDGMNVAEMNALLLKKVEELTLYVIAQNKMIVDLDKKNAKIQVLEKKIAALEKTINN